MKNFIKNSLLLTFFLLAGTAFAQEKGFAEQVLENYQTYKEKSLSDRRFTHSDIQPLIADLRNHPKFEVQKIGASILGRELNLISIGTGKTSVLFWSQMHGDESTATMALFDLFNFLKSDDFSQEKADILSEVSLHFIPMLNPDGAQEFKRRNALGIDINRDALRLQSPVSQALKRIRDSLNADFGFNLHDQSVYYSAGRTGKPATISFLAPAFNYEKDIDKKRAASMKLIVVMNEVLQKYMPGQVARYSDDFEPRAFGDNIQKWGTRTILIESGGYPNDPEKQVIRKMNFLAILTAVKAIAQESYASESISDYENIPKNNRNLFDLKLTGLHYNLLGNSYVLDLGINHRVRTSEKAENGYYYVGNIEDQGDLSTSFAYNHVNASEYTMLPGKIYPKEIKNMKALKKLNFSKLLKEGYAYFRVKKVPKGTAFAQLPVIVVDEFFRVGNKLNPGANPTFFLSRAGTIEAAVINGFYTDFKNPKSDIENGLIWK